MEDLSSRQGVSLGSLPLELLCNICDYVDLVHKPSVQAFALVNHALNTASTASLFSTVTIEVREPVQLSKEVGRWVELLSHRGFHHVRRLVVEGRMRRPYVFILDDHQMQSENARNNINLRRQAIPKPSAFHLDQTPRLNPDRKSHRTTQKDDATWVPLARLIEKLSKLSDLIYACTNQFSPCLLQTLETFRPDCKLHMKTFRLRSLNEDQIDAHELALAKSPCLHSISVAYCSHCSSDGRRDHNEDAVMGLVAGHAPNLKEVSTIFVDSGYHTMGYRPPWQGFAKDKQEQMSSLGSLQVLDLDGYRARSMRKWLARTDLAALQVFRYHEMMSADQLIHLETESNFPSLTTLSLNLGDDHEDISRQAYFDILDRFLRSLPSLASLELVGELDHPTFLVVLEMSGTRLKKLCLLPDDNFAEQLVVRASEVEMIKTSFPHLEELILKAPRSRGNANEVAIYKALGSLPKLRRLSLTLDATDLAVRIFDRDKSYSLSNDPTFDQFEQESFDEYSGLRNGHVRDLFINSASDEVLACSIFDTISAVQPAETSLFEYLRMQIIRGGTYNSNVRSVAAHLARPWIVERHANTDKFDVVIVTENERPIEEAEDSLGPPALNGQIEEIFRRIWPAKQKNGDWRQDWKSWPL
jgi:hypothetical protein